MYVVHVGHIFDLCYFAFSKISKRLSNTKKFRAGTKIYMYCIFIKMSRNLCKKSYQVNKLETSKIKNYNNCIKLSLELHNYNN